MNRYHTTVSWLNPDGNSSGRSGSITAATVGEALGKALEKVERATKPNKIEVTAVHIERITDNKG